MPAPRPAAAYQYRAAPTSTHYQAAPRTQSQSPPPRWRSEAQALVRRMVDVGQPVATLRQRAVAELDYEEAPAVRRALPREVEVVVSSREPLTKAVLSLLVCAATKLSSTASS